MEKPSRPIGITVLVILQILSGIILGILGFVGLWWFGMGAEYGWTTLEIAVRGNFIVSTVFLMGVITCMVAWGMWTGKGWAWKSTLILTLAGVIVCALDILRLSTPFSSFQGNPFGALIPLIIEIIIIGILYHRPVKAYCGK